MNRRIALILILVLTGALASPAQKVSPAKGSLVIVGGNMRDPAIFKRFIELAGGDDARFVIIPTAGDADEYDQSWSGLREFKEAGMKNITVLHTRNRKIADSEEFVKPIREARGVFFAGGRQWRLADAYLHTRTHRELQALLDRGGVIGGSSAGATILGSFMVRGDTKGNEVMIGDHLESFGFLKNVAIDQHVLVRNRQFDMLEVIEKYPNLLGIAIDENTAIVVQGDRFEVIGQTYVLVSDNAKSTSRRGEFSFLKPGDTYDLAKRESRRPSQAPNASSDLVRTIVGRLDLERYKAHIKGLTQFGDRMQGTQRNRDAIDWLEKQLKSFGYTNVERHRFMSNSGPLENIYATKIGRTRPGEMYIVSAHMDGRGGGEAADDDGSGCAVVLELARVLGMSDVQTDRSVRFVFWNNEEFGMDGSGTYARERAPLQGTAAEPQWLGVIQHDMMMYDHGMPPGPKQSGDADIDIEYQRNSKMAADSAKLAAALQASNRSHAPDYPATIGENMAGTDSIRFQDLVASVSVRENQRVTGIVRGSNPNHHQPTDKYENYAEEDFRFGFTSTRTTLGALGQLAGITLVRSRTQ